MDKDIHINELAAKKKLWLWLPSLYFVKGIPYAVLTILAMVVFKRMGLSNSVVTFYISWFLLGWIAKPLWRPVVDTLITRRFWVLLTELLMAALLYVISIVMVKDSWLGYSFFYMLLLSVVACTHDVAVNNYYIEQLNRHSSPRFVVIRRIFSGISLLIVSGVMAMVGGNMEVITRRIDNSWAFVFYLLSIVVAIFFIYHLIVLRRPSDDMPIVYRFSVKKFRRMFRRRAVAFFRKPKALHSIIFLVLYPVSFGLLTRVSVLFLIDRPSYGGLGLSPQDFGFVEGTVGVSALIVGGIFGLLLKSRFGLRRSLLLMTLSLLLAPLPFLLLSFELPQELFFISICIAAEHFLIGFGLNAYLAYLEHFSRGIHSSAHKGMSMAITAFTLMVTGVISGDWQEAVGYQNYFTYVTISGFIMIIVLPLIYTKELPHSSTNEHKDK